MLSNSEGSILPEATVPSARAEWRQGWTVVLAAAVGMGLLSLPTYSMGIFMKPLEDEFGWSRSAIAGGHLFGAVSGLIMGPLIGLVIDRGGPRRLALVGSVLACSLFAMLSLVGPGIMSWWILWAALSTAGLLIKPTVWTAGVSSLFSANRGMALAITLSGTALASTLTPPLGNLLIENLGWRWAYLALAGIWALLALPVIFLFFDSAHDRLRTASPNATSAAPAAALSGVSPRAGLLSLRFAKLALAAFTATLISASYVTTMVPILVADGQTRGYSAAIAGLMGMMTVVGRLCSGYFSDRLNANYIAAVTFLLPVIASLLLLTTQSSSTAAAGAAILMGLTLGAKLHFVAYLTTRHFGMRSFGVLFGTIAGLFGLAAGVGPVVLNLCYDEFGSYDLAILGTIPLALLASMLFLTLGRYPRFE